MKLEIKMIAIAAALAALAGGVQAQVTTQNTNNGSFVLTVINPVNKAWYMRDLGFTIDSFLPSGVMASVGNPSSVLVGDKTPEAGLVLNASNTSGFAGDANWNTWFAGQTNASDLRWLVAAGDTFTGGANGVRRLLVSSANPGETAANGQVDNFVGPSRYGSVQGFLTGSAPSLFDINGTSSPYANANDDLYGLGADGLAPIGQDVRLFYFARSVATGQTGTLALGGAFANSAGAAMLSLSQAGGLSYAVSAVPMPASVWLMGAGLLAVGSIVRRSKAAAQA